MPMLGYNSFPAHKPREKVEHWIKNYENEYNMQSYAKLQRLFKKQESKFPMGEKVVVAYVTSIPDFKITGLLTRAQPEAFRKGEVCGKISLYPFVYPDMYM